MNNPNAIVSSKYGPIIININDTHIGRHISHYGYWALDDIQLIKSLIEFQLKKFDTVVFYDVGANIGTHTLAIAKTFLNKVKIRSFEAQRQIFNMLCGTMAINGITNAYCYHTAVSELDGTILDIPLLDYTTNNNFGGLELMALKSLDKAEALKYHTEKVTTLCLDSFNERVDFIKIDVEGMEDKVLMGAQQSIRNHKPICYLELQKTDSEYVVSFLKNLNYCGYIKDDKGDVNLLAVPHEYQIEINILRKLF